MKISGFLCCTIAGDDFCCQPGDGSMVLLRMMLLLMVGSLGRGGCGQSGPQACASRVRAAAAADAAVVAAAMLVKVACSNCNRHRRGTYVAAGCCWLLLPRLCLPRPTSMWLGANPHAVSPRISCPRISCPRANQSSFASMGLTFEQRSQPCP